MKIETVGDGWKVEIHRGCKVFRLGRFCLTKFFDSDAVELTIRPVWSTDPLGGGGESSFIPSEVVEFLLNLKGTEMG